MYTEIAATILASLGGATVIVAAFAHFLGKIWTDRISKETSDKFNSQLENLKSKNVIALEEFKSSSSLILKEKENFAGISQEFYQDYFKERVNTYLKLLEIKNSYITEMEEEFITELQEGWSQVYHSTYKSLRKLMIEKQLYISNELEISFTKFRKQASEYIKEVDMAEAFSDNTGNPQWENEQIIAVYDKFAQETIDNMNEVLEKIDQDVSMLRSRIEIDKA